ncbi:hypothetical protein RHODOSMS8_02456 [Rhodobiaceae bacterium]|nr:hypothetical protein RHODOSMS8_02456 [Rhodobiaceae bacterium]
MNETYAELATLRHVRVDGRAALDYLASQIDSLVYELQLKNQNLEKLNTTYAALNQVRLYFQLHYREQPLDHFRRKLNKVISEAAEKADMRTAAKVRILLDDAVTHCIESGQLYETTAEDAARWLQVATMARETARQHHKHTQDHSSDTKTV